MSTYLDTSFLVSLYTLDANSEAAARQMAAARGPFPITPLLELELANAIQLRRFRREIRKTQADAANAALAADIAGGVYAPVPLSAAAFRSGRQLILRHTAVIGARTLDVLHVASALVLEAAAFYTFDNRQRALAAAAALSAPVLK